MMSNIQDSYWSWSYAGSWCEPQDVQYLQINSNSLICKSEVAPTSVRIYMLILQRNHSVEGTIWSRPTWPPLSTLLSPGWPSSCRLSALQRGWPSPWPSSSPSLPCFPASAGLSFFVSPFPGLYLGSPMSPVSTSGWSPVSSLYSSSW